MAVIAAANGTKTPGATTPGEVATDNTMLAAYFWCEGYRPVDVRGQRPSMTFVFQDVPQDVIRAFHLDTAKVSPMQFGQAYKSLLRLLHQS